MGKRCLMALAVCGMVVLALRGALAQPLPVDATCTISAAVGEIMEWEGAAFPAVALGTMTTQAGVLTGSSFLVLYTNGDVDITADKTDTSQLSEGGGDTLYTEYSLTYDGNGISATGGDTEDWTVHSSFLSPASGVTHIAGDGAVEVTLGVRASNVAGTLADAGAYGATQTLTATWAGP